MKDQSTTPWSAIDDAGLIAAINRAIAADDLDTVIAALQVLVARRPDLPALRHRLATACNNRGSRRAAAGALNDAQLDFERALETDPSHAEALFNRARLLTEQRQWALALLDYAQLAALRPDDPEIALDHAEVAAMAGREDGLENLARCVDRVRGDRRVDPLRVATALATLGRNADANTVLAACDPAPRLRLATEPADRMREGPDWRSAREAFRIAARFGADGEHSPSLRAAIGSLLALPQVYADSDALIAARKSFVDGLDRLVATYRPDRLRRCEPRLEQLAWTNQLLAYQGGDDRELATRYGDWLDGALRVLAPAWCESPRRRVGARPRIGIVSSGFYRSALGNYFGAWIDGLAADDLAPHVFLIDTPADDATTQMTASAAATVHLSGSVERMASALHDAEMDLLIYPDVGINARAMLLAALRLAPRQWSAWGHPVTTGLASIDAFISCAGMEPVDGTTHYREKLLLLPEAGTAFRDPGVPELLERDAFGLDRAAHVYLVPHVAPKLHPDTDAALAGIAVADPQAVLLLVRADRPAVQQVIETRIADALRRAGAAPQHQLRFLAPMPRRRFLGLCRVADCMIDTPHWSGGANTADALRCGLPVVTAGGRHMRARQTLGMLARTGLAEAPLTGETSDLPDRAVGIARERLARGALGRRIETQAVALFEGSDTLRALAQLVRTALADR